jgi:hypothetical protein
MAPLAHPRPRGDCFRDSDRRSASPRSADSPASHSRSTKAGNADQHSGWRTQDVSLARMCPWIEPVTARFLGARPRRRGRPRTKGSDGPLVADCCGRSARAETQGSKRRADCREQAGRRADITMRDKTMPPDSRGRLSFCSVPSARKKMAPLLGPNFKRLRFGRRCQERRCKLPLRQPERQFGK